ncbi:MAG: DUF6508 domain-containing protein [Desulfobacterales bacterium]|nr:DUF6508 domain-containing protein [Desulfobacterales bacterium]
MIAFLPKLYAEGFKPVKHWLGGLQEGKQIMTMPWPEYDQVVTDFFHKAGKECWRDYGYDPDQTGQMIRDADFVKNSSLDEVKTMLTYCVRGERFCDGHWGEMIESGTIRNLLERLTELGSLM